MTFMFPRHRKHDLFIHLIESHERGGMKEMLDAICLEYECELIRFNTVISETLIERLHGFEKVTETIEEGPYAGEKWEAWDGKWDPARSAGAEAEP